MLARIVLPLIGVLAILGLAAAPAAAVTPAEIETALEGWAPTDGTWTETESLDTEGTRGDCSEGHVTRWQNEHGLGAGFVWARCGDAATAAALLNLTWASNVMFPDPTIPTAFGAGLDLASPYANRDGVNRLWTQGEWFFTVARSCAPDDRSGCLEQSAADAHSIAALVGLPVDPVVPVARVAGDLIAQWSPSDDNGWQLAAASPLLGDDLERCVEGGSTTWTGLDGAAVEAYWVRCADSQVAFAFQNEKWGENAADLPLVFGPNLDRVAQFTGANDAEGVERSWVEGDLYVNVLRTCPVAGASECSDLTAQYARELAALLPGEVTEDTTLAAAVEEAGWLFFVVPIVTFLLLYVPQRIYFWWRSRGYSVDTDNPDFTAVDSLVRRVRAGRIIRRIIVTVLSAVAWAFGMMALPSLLGNWTLLYTFLSPFVFFAVFGLALQLVWKPHPLIALARRRDRPSPLGALGASIRFFAAVLAGFSVVVYFFASLMLITDRETTPATVQAQIDVAMSPPLDPASFSFGLLRLIVHTLDDSGTFFLVFLALLVVPVTFAWVLDRFGQRLARRGLQATLETDTRPYFLYLRGFDEDRLRVDESVGRRGFLELFTPFGRPRFEEVLVDYLSRYGPVIAISGGRQVLSDLGAAKITLGDHEWQDRVREWSSGARAVVMSATPREVRAGLEWEMQHVSTSRESIRLMLVVSPWGRAEVARRWAGFLATAAELPLFTPLAERPMPSGVQVMTYSPEHGWRGYGARRRWDWTYAASIITAMDTAPVDAEPQRAAPGRAAPERIEA
ncbi:hypothetical protein BH10ACT7_BH10ACT7_27730 [soil metagenome]